MDETAPKGEVRVFHNQAEAYFFNCSICGKELRNTVRFTTAYKTGKFGAWCPYCGKVSYYDVKNCTERE